MADPGAVINFSELAARQQGNSVPVARQEKPLRNRDHKRILPPPYRMPTTAQLKQSPKQFNLNFFCLRQRARRSMLRGCDISCHFIAAVSASFFRLPSDGTARLPDTRAPSSESSYDT